jgi:ligand-binding sensor domain-containing protein
MDREINGLEQSGGLAKFDGVNWTVYNTSNSRLPDNYVRAIAIDGQGNKWIGTEVEGLQSLMELIGLFITLQILDCLLTMFVQ